MKNNFFKLLLLILFFYAKVANSQEIILDSKNIKILENGNVLKSYNGKATIPEENIEIDGDIATYNKAKQVLTIIKNVKFLDKEENVYIESDKIIYDKKKDIVYSYKNTLINIENKYEIMSSDINYNRKTMIMNSKVDTHVRDQMENIYNFEQGFILDNVKEIITARKSKVIDNQNNYYNFDNVKIDLKIKEILGKEVKIDFEDALFGNKENDPQLKGRSVISNDKFTKIYKSVFSTCNTEENRCRGWELHSKEFNHDKEKQIFEYKNSWLKMFGKKVIFFPYFNHPDPTVKRKSGFLTPSYASSNNLGRWVKIPYYKVISVDKDLTFSPKIYRENDFILQTEFRQDFENSFLISDLSYNQDGGSTNANVFANLTGKLNSETDYELQFQNSTNDDFLKKHSMHYSSPIITSESTLVSKIATNTRKFKNDKWGQEINDWYLSTEFISYENLGEKNSDKYQYVLPNFNFEKNVEIPADYNGSFTFYSSGYQKNYDTNIYEAVINNNFSYESFDYILDNGIQNNYKLLVQNNNKYSEADSVIDYHDTDLYGTALFKSSFPLKKELEDSINYFKPIMSARYSPNGSNDISDDNVRLNYSNIFGMNRIGTSDTVESGGSISLGAEFEKINLAREKIYGLKIANTFKSRNNENLPTSSSLNKTRSDIVGNFYYKPNKNFDLDYTFSANRDLEYINDNNLSLNFQTANFATKFDYNLEHNDLAVNEHITNTTTFIFDERSKIDFKTAKDLETSFTEYVDLIYTYESDCLSAELEFKRTFYRSGNAKPDSSLFLLIKFIPFAEFRARDRGIQNY